MNDNSAQADAPKVSLLVARRRFISEEIHQKGTISENEIRGWLKQEGYPSKETEVALKTFRTDMEFLRDFEDRKIFEKRDPDSKELSWFDDSRPLGATRNERLKYCYDAKSKIGEVILSLLLGFKKITLDRRHDDGGKDVLKIETLDDVKRQIRDFYKADKNRLLEKLTSFWESSQREIFLDAGTTTHIFARDFLQYCPIPMFGLSEREARQLGANQEEEASINRCDVITNDRHIFYCLGQSNIEPRVTMVGGAQQYRSSAVAGIMAERFLKVNRLTAGMAIIATSDVCLGPEENDRSFICADSEPVGSIKVRFMERADIRVVVADSSKFHFKKKHSGWQICAIKQRNIDLVITDKATPELREHFKKLGVPLVAYPES